MRVIISRKGFDTQNGGQPSPILPDGTLLSLPIPSKDDKVLYSDLKYSNKTYLQIIKELNPNSKFKEYYACHLDPDLREDIVKRKNDWSPLFGQTGSAQGHLLKNNIKEGDLFLFFGWFKEAEQIDGILRYKRNSPDKHVIFGYLEIGKIYSNKTKYPDEVQHHPHAQQKYYNDNNNRIYKASDELSIFPSLNGGGCLNYHKDLVLTKEGYSKSKWDLPNFFKQLDVSYHDQRSFKDDYFQSVAKGQEFVIEENNTVTEWAKWLILNGITMKADE